MDSQYIIRAELKGIAAVVSDFERVRASALRTSKAMREGALSEVRTRREATRSTERARREEMRTAEREIRESHRRTSQAMKESERAIRDSYRLQQQMRRQDAADHQRYISQLRKQQSELEDKKGRSRKEVVVGAIGLGLTATGVRTAANFEAAMTELRLAIASTKGGATDMQLLNSQMSDLERLAVRLGNTLPGTTEDFVRLFISLKQGGMATKDILGGAGEAIANLAVLTHSDPEVLGKQFAQIGQMFKLKPDEYKAAVEQFHSLYRKGVDPSELIESAKFFAPRAGAPLGMTGIAGMTQAGLLLGALNRAGLAGGIGGRNVSMMMSRLTMETKPQQKMMAELRSKGINLDFFDKKGQFLGLDNVVMQLEKLKSLSQADRVRATHSLFTEEGATAASNVIDLGVEGMKAYRKEVESVIPTQEAIVELQKNFAEKWEAMIGTGTNVVVRVFTPLMDTLKPLVDGANSVLAALEGIAKTNPGLAQLLTQMLGMGSAVLVAKGAVSGLIASYRIWQITNRIATGEAVLGFQQVGAAATATGARVQTAGVSAGSRFVGGLKQGLLIGGALYLIEETIVAGVRNAEARAAAKEAGEKLGELLREGVRIRFSGMAEDVKKEMLRAQAPVEAQHRITQILEGKPIPATKGGFFSELPPDFIQDLQSYDAYMRAGKTTEALGNRDVQQALLTLRQQKFESSEQVTAFLEEFRKRLGATEYANLAPALERLTQQAYPGLFTEVAREMQLRAEQNRGLSEATTELKRFSQALGGVNPQPPFQFGKPTGPLREFQLPSRASGGHVRQSGFAYIHRGEDIVPANVTERFNKSISRHSALSVSPVINVNVDARGASDPRAVEEAVRRAVDRGAGDLKQAVFDILDEEFRDRALGY